MNRAECKCAVLGSYCTWYSIDNTEEGVEESGGPRQEVFLALYSNRDFCVMSFTTASVLVGTLAKIIIK